MLRWIRWGAALMVVVSMTACVLVPGRHGRLRVGVALPVPVIRVQIPGPVYTHAPAPYHHDHGTRPHDSGPSAPPASRGERGYPTAGYGHEGVDYGVVRSVESIGAGHARGGATRLVVDMDGRGLRAFDTSPDHHWRVGDRVRVERNQVFRD